MCGIIGFVGQPPQRVKEHLLRTASNRGRDGLGITYSQDGQDTTIKVTNPLPEAQEEMAKAIRKADRMVGNARATPTPEAETRLEVLQPFDGVVHNGTVANDSDLGYDLPVDSMVFPELFKRVKTRERATALNDVLGLIKGSFALLWTNDYGLGAALNYKPLYIQQGRNRKGPWTAVASEPEMFISDWPTTRLKPYSLFQLNEYGIQWQRDLNCRNDSGKRVLVSCSGGLDSTTVAFALRADGYDVTLCYFRYGCVAEEAEITRVAQIARYGNMPFVVLQFPPSVVSGTIVEGTYHHNAVEGAEWAHDWVSARNLIMLALMTGYAESQSIGHIAFGGNLEESGGYPDNEAEFGRLFNDLLPYATNQNGNIQLLQPVARMMKHEIVALGNEVGTPWHLTWSCYGNGDKHCGTCGPCFMRKTAFERNGRLDPVFL